jgi:RNA polymerase sigma-70 factor (ECF subfamily)
LAEVQEKAWLEQAIAGDPDAFAWLMTHYAGRIFGLCYSLLGNRQDAEDCTQEAFIKAYRSLQQYQYKSSFYTWLYRIAVNTCLDLQRKSRHPAAFSLDEVRAGEDSSMPMQLPDPGPLPDEAAINQELGQMIRAEIARLPDYLRETLVLRDIEGFSYCEIAQLMHISEGTVKSRLFRARAQVMQAVRSQEQSSRPLRLNHQQPGPDNLEG